MKLLLLSLLPLFASAWDASAADCADCTATKLCETHAAADKEATKALREGLANPDPAVRSGAIDL